jgi:transcriptional regulator with XRE-family HTH domain
MYENLLNAMKSKNVTMKQIAELLDCRYATISDKINGVTVGGFYFDEALKVKKVFFPELDIEFLYARTSNLVKAV